MEKKQKSGLRSELEKLSKYLTGELSLREEQELEIKKKEKEIEDLKDGLRKNIVKKEVVLEKEGGEEKKVIQKLTLFEWEAPIRFRIPLDMKTYITIVGVSMLFIVYLAVLGHFGLMAALIALLFFVYIAGTTEPLMVKHMITTKGVDTMDKLYDWYLLDSFFFTKKDDEYMLHVETKIRFPARLLLIVNVKDIQPIFKLLEDKLEYKDIRKQDWLERRNYGEYIKLEEVMNG